MAGGVFKISCPFCVTTTVMSDSACPRCGNGPETRKAEAESVAAKKARGIANKKAFEKKQLAAAEKAEAKAAAQKAADEEAEAKKAADEARDAEKDAKKAQKAAKKK